MVCPKVSVLTSPFFYTHVLETSLFQLQAAPDFTRGISLGLVCYALP